MPGFHCSVCGQLVFFENSACLRCGSPLGFDPDALELVTLTADVAPMAVAGEPDRRVRRCANTPLARCNWLVPGDGSTGVGATGLCRSCRLTRTRPNDDEPGAMAAFADAEEAKRRLLFQIFSLGLPLTSRIDDPETGVTFDLLSSRGQDVVTGHQGGVITLDLSESDPAHREFVRLQLGEAYRTVLGHFRHEIAHYYWPILVTDAGHTDRFRELFGDERESYQAAVERHYASEPPPGWEDTHVSPYATMHPWEDWAETFAHYLHIQSGLETADAYGLSVGEPAVTAARPAGSTISPPGTIGAMVEDWLELTYALNAMSHAIGQPPLYPFVLAPRVVEKLGFVHDRIAAAKVG
jgi:hypothetical protein